VDLEVARITSENLMTSDGLGAAKIVPSVASDSADQEEGANV
jgi:hypothetical protein